MRRGVSALVVSSFLMLLGSTVHAQVSIGVTIGQPPPPPVVYRVPPQPGPEFVWVDGYWYPHGHKYRWHDGYWTRAPFSGAYWVQPYYEGGRYFAGYWESGPRRVEHDHHWDRDHDRRDYGRRERD
jgi:YXWGXW repeat-containing protein